MGTNKLDSCRAEVAMKKDKEEKYTDITSKMNKKVLTNLILWLGAVICSVILESSSTLTLLLLSSALVSVLVNSNSNSK